VRRASITHSYPHAPKPPTTHIEELYTAHSTPPLYVTNIRPAPHYNMQHHIITTTAPRIIATSSHFQTHAHLYKQPPIETTAHAHHRNTLSPCKPRPNVDLTGLARGYIKYLRVPTPCPNPTPPSRVNLGSQTLPTLIRAPHTDTSACHVTAKKNTSLNGTNPSAINKYVKLNQSHLHCLDSTSWPSYDNIAIHGHIPYTHRIHIPELTITTQLPSCLKLDSLTTTASHNKKSDLQSRKQHYTSNTSLQPTPNSDTPYPTSYPAHDQTIATGPQTSTSTRDNTQLHANNTKQKKLHLTPSSTQPNPLSRNVTKPFCNKS
jgi:hypothetical protein